MSLGINRSGRIHQQNAYEVLEDLIFHETGISCSILVKPEYVSIRPLTEKPEERYGDFLVARKVIAGRISVPIRMDLFGK